MTRIVLYVLALLLASDSTCARRDPQSRRTRRSPSPQDHVEPDTCFEDPAPGICGGGTGHSPEMVKEVSIWLKEKGKLRFHDYWISFDKFHIELAKSFSTQGITYRVRGYYEEEPKQLYDVELYKDSPLGNNSSLRLTSYERLKGDKLVSARSEVNAKKSQRLEVNAKKSQNIQPRTKSRYYPPFISLLPPFYSR